MLLSLYAYAPLFVISVAFIWISYYRDWAMGYFFLFLPFITVLFFFVIILITKNDISNFVDLQRAARSKLPFQPPPAPITVGNAPHSRTPRRVGGNTGSVVIDMPPPLPMRIDAQRTPIRNTDDDAF